MGDTVSIQAVQGASMLDWPGRSAAVVFLAGCDFACAYCHNPELRQARPAALDAAAAVRRLRARRDWVGSVVVTGGEPLLSPGLEAFLRDLRAAGLAVAVNTNGSRPEVLAGLLSAGLLDRVNLDLKAPLQAYGSRPGLPDAGDDVGRSLALLQAHQAAFPGFELECRTTADRRYVTSAADVASLAALLGRGSRLVLQYARDGATGGKHSVTREEAEGWLVTLAEGIRPLLRGFPETSRERE